MRKAFLDQLNADLDQDNLTALVRLLNGLNKEDFWGIMSDSVARERLRMFLASSSLGSQLEAEIEKRIEVLADPDLKSLFFMLKEMKLDAVASYNISTGISRIQNVTSPDGRKEIFYFDGLNPEMLEINRPGFVTVFVGQCNTDIPLTYYFDFLRSYLVRKNGLEAVNGMCLKAVVSDMRPSFFHLQVLESNMPAIFALNKRLFITAKRNDPQHPVETVYFIKTSDPQNLGLIKEKWPRMLVFNSKFELGRGRANKNQCRSDAPPPNYYDSNPRPAEPSRSSYAAVQQNVHDSRVTAGVPSDVSNGVLPPSDANPATEPHLTSSPVVVPPQSRSTLQYVPFLVDPSLSAHGTLMVVGLLFQYIPRVNDGAASIPRLTNAVPSQSDHAPHSVESAGFFRSTRSGALQTPASHARRRMSRASLPDPEGMGGRPGGSPPAPSWTLTQQSQFRQPKPKPKPSDPLVAAMTGVDLDGNPLQKRGPAS